MAIRQFMVINIYKKHRNNKKNLIRKKNYLKKINNEKITTNNTIFKTKCSRFLLR